MRVLVCACRTEQGDNTHIAARSLSLVRSIAALSVTVRLYDMLNNGKNLEFFAASSFSTFLFSKRHTEISDVWWYIHNEEIYSAILIYMPLKSFTVLDIWSLNHLYERCVHAFYFLRFRLHHLPINFRFFLVTRMHTNRHCRTDILLYRRWSEKAEIAVTSTKRKRRRRIR